MTFLFYATLTDLWPQVFEHQTLPVDNADVVGDVNQHTHGTEFYGTSSNFVLLNQLFAYAQQHLPPGHAASSIRNETSYLSPSSVGSNDQSTFPDQNGSWTSGALAPGAGLAALTPGRVSIVNLLSNEEALSPPSRPKTPTHVTENQRNGSTVSSAAMGRARDGRDMNSVQHDIPVMTQQNNQPEDNASNPRSSAHPTTKEKSTPGTPVRAAKRRLEREYIRVFMSNLHHLHPMLDPIAFAARCDEEIWSVHTPLERKKDVRHFFALYNIVVAVGALIAGSSLPQDLEQDINLCMEQSVQSQSSSPPMSSQTLSRNYFRKSRALLGDVFEVCSLESAQTLLLMVSNPFTAFWKSTLADLNESHYIVRTLSSHTLAICIVGKPYVPHLLLALQASPCQIQSEIAKPLDVPGGASTLMRLT
jgi:hypothetical protein